MPAVGPELPPHLAKRKRDSDEEDSGPSPPTKIQAASPPRRVIGPAPPPAPFDQRPSSPPQETKPDSDADSSDDDEYGPTLPPAPGSAAAAEAEVQAAQVAADTRRAADAAANAKPKREEWMLVPPSDSDWGSRVDPTKLKNRKFASSKGAKAPAGPAGISTIWTETPEQKRQRLEDEVMGRKEKATTDTKAKTSRRDEAEAEEKARAIREYNEKHRGQSLMEQHKAKAGKEEEDDPSKRAFDREKDMGLGKKIGHTQKKDMLNRSADFGGRFERGSYL